LSLPGLRRIALTPNGDFRFLSGGITKGPVYYVGVWYFIDMTARIFFLLCFTLTRSWRNYDLGFRLFSLGGVF
jgi:hypothetical protein